MTIKHSFPSALTFAKPSGNNVLQPSPLRGSGCNTLLPLGLANVNARKRMFYPLIIPTWEIFTVQDSSMLQYPE